MAADDEDADAAGAPEADQWEGYINMAKTFGSGWLAQQIKPRLKRIVIDLIQTHDPDELERLILTDYPLVEKEIPDGTRNLLSKYGPHFSEEIVRFVDPDKIIGWLEDPDWLDDDADEEREELARFAEVLQDTPGGIEWLNEQVYAVYTIAGITGEAE